MFDVISQKLNVHIGNKEIGDIFKTLTKVFDFLEKGQKLVIIFKIFLEKKKISSSIFPQFFL
ncbi:MAG: hypothetical protein BAJALOKI3v1_470011 [Promethearchaeota archaeon]|nr:MAG: hypothetical protein BAJALOKI3v1_470011 [Candidatus Lokiarchaeota archaeon]